MSPFTPYLTTHAPEAIIRFYTEVFGFTIKKVVRETINNRIMFARMHVGDFEICLGPDVAFSGRTGASSPARSGTISPIFFYVYRPDVEALYQKCLDHGVEILHEMKKKFWGDLLFKARDPEGYIWDFAKCVGDPEPEKAPIPIAEAETL